MEQKARRTPVSVTTGVALRLIMEPDWSGYPYPRSDRLRPLIGFEFPSYQYIHLLQKYVKFSTMLFSQLMQTLNDPLGLVKVASIGLFVVLILKIIKSLTTRSPYEHIPGPKPSSMLGMLA